MKKILITGCAGFIGSHLTNYYLLKGYVVIGIDNLSRKGNLINLKWLKENKLFKFYNEDIRNFSKIVEIFKRNKNLEMVIHEAGQVAVTTSIKNPREDFEINALGTLNLLEAVRLYSPHSFFQYPSSNKVYGNLNTIKIKNNSKRYQFSKRNFSISEETPLDFHSPYGCSKGVADQYVKDYSRIYGLKTVILRQSCIYGTRQFGVEDQGWVAWFIIAAIFQRPITIYGNGKQVRDILWIEDLIGAYDLLYRNRDKVSGETYNVGGGLTNNLSLLELLDFLKQEGILKKVPKFADERLGDQKIYISNNTKIQKAIGWKNKTTVTEGLRKLIQWVSNNKIILQKVV